MNASPARRDSHSTPPDRTVVVYGAYGHTGRFVLAELLARDWTPVLSGRDAGRLRELAAEHHGLDVRPAAVDDPASLDRALSGAVAVVNCAGPFALTAAPVIEAALRAGIPYVDVAAELEAVADTFARFGDRAREAGTVVVPAMAFYGGLGDLLVSAALGDRAEADEVVTAYALSSWHPTAGTRAAGRVSRERRNGRRRLHTNGSLEYRTGEPPLSRWSFPEPVGDRDVVGEFTMADSVTVPRHVRIPEMRTFMSAEAVKDLASPDTPPPAAVDERGRSDQRFLVEVVVRFDGQERRAVARGRDIYAISAPLAVEAVARILDGRTSDGERTDGGSGGPVRSRPAGVVPAGALFDAADFLSSLEDGAGDGPGGFAWSLTAPPERS
ncbi:saccharopine dehydrogenase NADP-binding domain-containing protein [Streptomyces sp. NPDC053755]|uniref:saccharopine dehydrogenase family protein n=1 Tax=Streptomyces sp. NPDC053755 TaxID=3155815 RepID=UPI00342FC269